MTLAIDSQRFTQVKTAAVDSHGKVAIQFDPPPLGLTLTGTIAIISASSPLFPLGTIFDVNINDSIVPVAQVNGQTPAKNIQVSGTEYVTLTNETILGGGTFSYQGTTVTAVYVGFASIAQDTDIVNPDYLSQLLIDGGEFLGEVSNTGAVINIPDWVKSIELIGLTALPQLGSIVGGTTNFNYTANLLLPNFEWQGSVAFNLIPKEKTLTINFAGNDPNTVYVIGRSLPVPVRQFTTLVDSLLNPVSALQPLQVAMDGVTLAHTVATTTITTSGSAVLVAPPAAGNALEVVLLAGHPNFASIPTAATSNWSIINTVSGAKYIQKIAQTGQLDLDGEWSGKMYLTDGLTASCNVPAGNVMQYTAVYRTVPVP